MISGDGDGDHVEKIDLYNFEDPRFENSRYVLTSPRSLEACSRLNVKPVELLYKPLTEFQEELLPQDVPLRTIYNIYDEQEQIRLRKLHLCREERSRINKSDIPDIANGKKSAATDAGDSAKNTTKTGTQRQRTTWAVRPKQTRLKKDELNKRTKDVPDESAKLKHELLSRKDGKPRKPSSARPGSARPTARKAVATSGGPKTRCKSASEIYSKLPARDQKILELMKSKREEEKRQLEESERTRLLWEDEKRRQEALRTVMENKRRKLLAQQNHIKNVDKLRESQRRLNHEEKERNTKEYDILAKSKTADHSLYTQLKSEELRMCERKGKDSLRKSIQERNLQQQAQDEEDMKRRVADMTTSTLQQAHERKETGIFSQSLYKSYSNRQERIAFELRRRELEKDAKKQDKHAQSVSELRHSKVEENLNDLLESRNQQLMATRLEEEKRQEKARLTQQKLEEEMEAWRKRLLQHHKKVEKQAEIAVKVNVNSRAVRVRQERMAHQQDQKRNLDKLSKDHDRWKRSLVESLHEKDRKIVELQQQKDQYISQSREMAQMSQLMRDKVRMKYEHDTFDRKVLDAQIFAKLENRPIPRRLGATS